MKYIIWDKMDKQVHRGPWAKADCKNWLTNIEGVFGINQKLAEEVFVIRKFYTVNPKVAFGIGLAVGLAAGISTVVYGVATDQIQIAIIHPGEKPGNKKEESDAGDPA